MPCLEQNYNEKTKEQLFCRGNLTIFFYAAPQVTLRNSKFLFARSVWREYNVIWYLRHQH